MSRSTRDEQGRPYRSAEDAFAAFLALKESGEAPSLDDWVQAYPQFEQDLKRYDAQWAGFESDLDALFELSRGERPAKTLFHRSRKKSTSEPSLDPALVHLEPGTKIGDFELVEKLAQGGMGQVWEALQTSLQRPVAMKFIRPDRVTDMSVAFFSREGRAGARLNHPGVVTVHATGEDDGVHWIAQELVPGGCTLRDFVDEVREAGRVPGDYDRRVAAFFLKLTDALQAAHDAKVIHRDLKPQNILITEDDEPKVTDFGLARLMDEASISGPLSLEGTPYYMSPEQAAAKVVGIDHRTDIFSFGALLFEVLTLKRPFDGDSQAQLYEHILHDDPVDPRKLRNAVPEDLAVICLKALEKRRQDRYQTMAELGEDLRRFLCHEPILARRPSAWQRARKWVRRHPELSTAAGIALLVVCGGGWAAYQVSASGDDALRLQKENLVLQADYAIDDAYLADAEQLMAEYGELDEDDWMPQLVLARAYSQYLRTAEAKEQFALAEAKGFVTPDPPDPEDAEEQYLYGLALIITGDPESTSAAIASLDRAIELDPLLRAAYFPLYRALRNSGDTSGAERALAAFQGILPSGDDYYEVVEATRLELEGHPREAIDVLLALESRVSSERAADLRLNRSLGRLYLLLAHEPGDLGAQIIPSALDSAEERLKRSLEELPKDSNAWECLSTVEIRRYQEDRAAPEAEEFLANALQCAERAVELSPESVNARHVHLVAATYLAIHRFDAFGSDDDDLVLAQTAADELRRLDPDHEVLRLQEGRIAFYRGMRAEVAQDDTEVERLYERSLELDPNQVAPRLWLAITRYSQSDYQAALDQLVIARQVLSEYAGTLRIRALHPAMKAKVHIWTLGLAGLINSPDADDIGLAAMRDVERHLAGGESVEPVELLNYVEFLGTSPSEVLRDCRRAREVLEEARLSESLGGGPFAANLRTVERMVADCD